MIQSLLFAFAVYHLSSASIYGS